MYKHEAVPRLKFGRRNQDRVLDWYWTDLRLPVLLVQLLIALKINKGVGEVPVQVHAVLVEPEVDTGDRVTPGSQRTTPQSLGSEVLQANTREKYDCLMAEHRTRDPVCLVRLHTCRMCVSNDTS